MSLNRITKIRIQNYKSLKDCTVELGNLNILVGKNGSGKSNFLDALAFLRNGITLGFDKAYELVVESDQVHGLLGNIQFELLIQIDSNIFQYIIIINIDKGIFKKKFIDYEKLQSQNDYLIFEKEDDWLTFEEGKYEFGELANSHSVFQMSSLDMFKEYPSFKVILDLIANISIYDIPITDLAYNFISDIDYPLDKQAINLISVLNRFQRTSELFPSLERSLKLAVPHLDSWEIQQTHTNNLIMTFTSTTGDRYAFRQESDGTLRLLALLLALYQDPPRSITAIEEPELSVHPGVLPILADVIKEASQRTQVIITTHSPDLISQFDVNDLRIVERTENGTQIGKLEEGQREVIEQELFNTSDLLHIQGELRRQTAE